MKSEIEFRAGGTTRVVQTGENETILDCALRNSIPAPYSCLEGICSSCTAVVVSGEVEDVVGGDTVDPSSGQKLIQTCQSRIKKNCTRLVVDYDAV
ncbi:MAG: 2Fe-2S iron-sulfur cluster-binding protein [Bdellovibrio sp.]|jgi:ring-1,2-phenylacetyl-CoA epoxidase subunit PaaE